MISAAIRLILLLTLILGVTFGINSFVQDFLEIGSFERHIVLNYCFNYLLSIGFFIALIILRKKQSNQLGFIFLFSSIFKFILFFIFIYSGLEEKTGVSSPEFASFFIPYGISTVAEILFTVRMLNSTSESQ